MKRGMLCLLTLLAAQTARAQQQREPAAAIRAGLEWLAENQITEGPEAGSWDTPRSQYRPAVASLAGLAFLANGYLPGDEGHGQVVERAMTYVMQSMRPDGYLGMDDRSGMYIHAISSLFGLSYLGTSDDAEREQELAEWCRKSINVIVEAQRIRRSTIDQGGWRYTPYTSESDVSVTSWQLLVLHAAQQCGYPVDPGIRHAGLAYVNRAFITPGAAGVGEDGIGGVLYRPGVSQVPEPAVTGIALYIKSLLEAEADQRTESALAYLDRYPPSWGGSQFAGYFYFTLFYMAQGMFQVGGERWETYASQVNEILMERQSGTGTWPYPPDNTAQSRLTGEAYPAAMAILVLSLDKQYLPTYQRQSRLF